MTDASTRTARPLLPEFVAGLAAQRPAFRQARSVHRATALGCGWLGGTAGRRTVTQTLLALGEGDHDWSGWYRLFSTPRLDADRLSREVVRQALPHAPAAAPFVAVVDGLAVPRASRTMLGTSWLRHPETPAFKPGIRRAQRFVDLAWLPAPSATGYRRAVPLRLAPAFPPKAVPVAGVDPCPEWAAGLAQATWLRSELDAAERTAQPLLVVGDGGFSNAPTWAGLPARTTLLARCARNRALFRLPPPYAGVGRPRVYGDRAPRPDAWLARRDGWQTTTLTVRGRAIPVQVRVAGPYLVKGAPDRPLFRLVAKGSDPRHGRRRRDPAAWLVSAVERDGRWRLPLPPRSLLAWAWQRWEVAVAHRELKTGFGLGEPQAWGPVSAVLTVQWAAALYATALLAGLRAWGLGPSPLAPPGRWWGGAGRWSLDALWRGRRAEL